MLYLEIIVAVGLIVVVVALYLIFKKSKNGKKEVFVVDKSDTVHTEVEAKKVENIQQEKKLVPKKEKKQKQIREVPPHDKITKDDFKEFAGVKILIAEDNLINQRVIGSIFDGSGIEITIADNGQDALDILEKDNSYKIILMDANMPVMDGYEATRRIKENERYDDITVVALSGDTASDDIKRMHEAGMEEHLAKPIKLDALYEIIYKYTPSNNAQETTAIKEDKVIENVVVEHNETLDTKKGLELCMDDEAFYKEILQEFITNYSDSAMKLKELLDEENVVHADRKLLDIVGITANIGAKELHSIAKQLKKSIINSKKDDYMKIVQMYEEELYKLIKEIEKF